MEEEIQIAVDSEEKERQADRGGLEEALLSADGEAAAAAAAGATEEWAIWVVWMWVWAWCSRICGLVKAMKRGTWPESLRQMICVLLPPSLGLLIVVMFILTVSALFAGAFVMLQRWYGVKDQQDVLNMPASKRMGLLIAMGGLYVILFGLIIYFTSLADEWAARAGLFLNDQSPCSFASSPFRIFYRALSYFLALALLFFFWGPSDDPFGWVA